jgi:hypothetical protein
MAGEILSNLLFVRRLKSKEWLKYGNRSNGISMRLHHCIPIQVIICFSFVTLICMPVDTCAQVMYGSMDDTGTEIIINQDRRAREEMYDLSAKFHFSGRLHASDSIYDYLVSKNLYVDSIPDSVHVGAFRLYLNLTHLGILKHRYKDAQAFLQLADMATQPQYWRGFVHELLFWEMVVYNVQCRLGLANPSGAPQMLADLTGMALENGVYAGEGVVHYLRYRYGEEEMGKILNKARYTINARKLKGVQYNNIEATGHILGCAFSFGFHLEGIENADLATIKKKTVDYFIQRTNVWRGID